MSNLRLHDVVLKEVAETDEDFTWQVGTSFREQGMTFPTFLRILFGIEKERIPKYRPDPFAVHADRRSHCSRSRTLITYRITCRDFWICSGLSTGMVGNCKLWRSMRRRKLARRSHIPKL
jgi:transposase